MYPRFLYLRLVGLEYFCWLHVSLPHRTKCSNSLAEHGYPSRSPTKVTTNASGVCFAGLFLGARAEYATAKLYVIPHSGDNHGLVRRSCEAE